MKVLQGSIALIAMITAATAVVLGSPASPAAAAITPIGLTTESKNFFAGFGQTTVEGMVTCSSGTAVVAAAAGGVILDTVRPVGETQVSATGRINATGDALTVTAVCAPVQRLGVVTSRTLEFPSGGKAFRQNVVPCPDGFYAYGGGGFYRNSLHGTSSNGHNMVANSPSADGTKWTFGGTDNVLSDTMVITTHCAQMASPRRDFIVQAGAKSIAGNFVGGFADCPAGTTAVSGGVYLSNADGSVAPGRTAWSIPASRAGAFSSWFALGAADSAVNTKTVTLAQCIF
jgi:hypothetical protein